VHRVQLGDRRCEVPARDLSWRSGIWCAGIELAQRLKPQPRSERVDRHAELAEIVHAKRSHVGVSAVQHHPPKRPSQLCGAAGVAELLKPCDVTVEKIEVDTETAVAHLMFERTGERARQQHRIIQPDAVHQRQVGQVRHDHARAAVRVLPADAVLFVQQPLPRRRVEPVL